MDFIKLKASKKTLFSFLLSDSLKERVKNITAYRGRGISDFINEAIENHLDVWEAKIKTQNEHKEI